VRYLIGIGNYYGFDDSIGLRVAETIGERGLDRDFQAIDLGGNLLDLAHYVGAGVEQVLIVDSARMGLAPGDFTFFAPDDAISRKSTGAFSTHEGDLMKALQFVSVLGEPMAPITIMGIEPAAVRSEPGLSEALAARFDEYVDAAVAFISVHG
jgi:hydrogenase maturation protease